MKTFFTLCALSGFLLTQYNGFSQRNIACSWLVDSSYSDNIVPMLVLSYPGLQSKSLDKVISEKFKPELARMPAGHRVIRVHDKAIEKTLHYDKRDTLFCSSNCKASTWSYDGDPYNGIWLNHGMDSLKKTFTIFFSALKDSGVVIDEVILDTENDEGRFKLQENADLRYGGGTTINGLINRKNYYKAINADDRFIKTFKDTFQHYLGYYHDSILHHDVFKTWGGTALTWNNMAHIVMKNYKDTAVYFPIKTFYPNIKLSEYNYRYYSAKYPVPSRQGHPVYKYGKGIHIGTHQTVNSYGDIKNKLVTEGRGLPLSIYPATVFNALVYDINNLRAAILSSPVPVKNWIAAKNWLGDAAFAHLYKNNDYYQELVFHTLLSGSEIIYWNHEHIKTSDQLVSNLLHRFDTLTGYGLGNGYADPVTTINNIWSWGYKGRNDTCCANYLITGMKINSTDVNYDTLWRFTPLFGNSPLSTLDSNDYNDIIISSSNPVIFRLKYDKSLTGEGAGIGYDTIVFPGNTEIIYSGDTLSKNGFWIIHRTSSGNHIKKTEQIPELKLFPNPTKELLTVQYDESAIKEIKIFNLLGEMVFAYTTNNTPKKTINVSNLQTGVYIVTIKTNTSWIYRKLIVER